MAKLKVEDILKSMNSEFGAPCNFNNFSKFIIEGCPLSENETCEGKSSHEDCWKRVFEIKNELNKKNITFEEYSEMQTMKTQKTPRAKRQPVTTEELLQVDCWSNKLYENAYDIVKDRLYPVVIPTYNRPACGFLKWVNDIVVPGYEYPIYLVVRQSQKELYEASEYVRYKDYIHVKAFPDEMIDDIGKVRQQIVNAFSKKFECVFMFDDDITNFCHSVPWHRSNGEPKAQGVKSNNFGKTMAMWQLAMEYAVKKYDVAFSTGMMQGFSWVPDFINVEQSMRILSGLPTLAVCVNLRKLKENDLNYRTIIGNGHDDIDLLIRCLQKGLLTAEFRWMTYSSPGIGTDILHFNTAQERFTQQQKEMYENFKDVPWVKWVHVRGLDNVGINWRKVLEEYKEKGYGDFANNRNIDLWRNGKLLEDAKNNYSE